MHESTQQLSVLLAGDDGTFLSQFSNLLNASNLSSSIIQVSSFEAVIKQLDEQHVDCILADTLHADIDVVNFLKKINECDAGHIPVIACVEQGFEELGLMAIEIGASDYLIKDECTSHRMASGIQAALARGRHRNATQDAHADKLHNEQEKLEQANIQLSYLSKHDVLTALPNREVLMDKIWLADERRKRQSRLYGLVHIGLDKFKQINEQLGREHGDLLLKEVTQRLKKVKRANDLLVKLDGDEFVLLADDLNDAHGLRIVADKCMEAIAQPFTIDDAEVRITSSIGISTPDEESVSPERLLNHSAIALFQANQAGGSNFQFYSADVNTQIRTRVELEKDIRIALKEKQFEMYYQPKVELATNKIIGAEALIRWQHPTRGFVSPDVFIELAEESDLIIDIGHWVQAEVCRQIREWIDLGIEPLKIALNVSSVEFVKGTVLTNIMKEMGEQEVAGNQLELEITERTIVENIEENISVFRHLGDQKISLAIDDFGTGYSSFSYLKNYNIDILKIDKSFIDDLVTNEKDAAIAGTIISMAQHLGIGSVAEGVETVEQRDFLIANGCDFAQGYLFGKPQNATEFTKLLQQGINLQETA